MKISVVVLSLLWSLVEVHSQTEYPPYVSFMGENLPNHSYVDFTLVGNVNSDPGNTVRCITDLSTCCSNGQGSHRGDWFFPNETRLRPPGAGDSIFEYRSAQRVDLRHRHYATSSSGIYRCDIATVAVNDYNDLSVRETVYVGLYAYGGDSMHV